MMALWTLALCATSLLGQGVSSQCTRRARILDDSYTYFSNSPPTRSLSAVFSEVVQRSSCDFAFTSVVNDTSEPLATVYVFPNVQPDAPGAATSLTSGRTVDVYRPMEAAMRAFVSNGGVLLGTGNIYLTFALDVVFQDQPPKACTLGIDPSAMSDSPYNLNTDSSRNPLAALPGCQGLSLRKAPGLVPLLCSGSGVGVFSFLGESLIHLWPLGKGWVLYSAYMGDATGPDPELLPFEPAVAADWDNALMAVMSIPAEPPVTNELQDFPMSCSPGNSLYNGGTSDYATGIQGTPAKVQAWAEGKTASILITRAGHACDRAVWGACCDMAVDSVYVVINSACVSEVASATTNSAPQSIGFGFTSYPSLAYPANQDPQYQAITLRGLALYGPRDITVKITLKEGSCSSPSVLFPGGRLWYAYTNAGGSCCGTHSTALGNSPVVSLPPSPPTPPAPKSPPLGSPPPTKTPPPRPPPYPPTPSDSPPPLADFPRTCFPGNSQSNGGRGDSASGLAGTPFEVRDATTSASASGRKVTFTITRSGHSCDAALSTRPQQHHHHHHHHHHQGSTNCCNMTLDAILVVISPGCRNKAAKGGRVNGKPVRLTYAEHSYPSSKHPSPQRSVYQVLKLADLPRGPLIGDLRVSLRLQRSGACSEPGTLFPGGRLWYAYNSGYNPSTSCCGTSSVPIQLAT